MFGPAVIQKTVNQAVNGYIFLNQERIRQQKERGWALPFICFVEETVGL